MTVHFSGTKVSDLLLPFDTRKDAYLSASGASRNPIFLKNGTSASPTMIVNFEDGTFGVADGLAYAACMALGVEGNEVRSVNVDGKKFKNVDALKTALDMYV